MFRSNCRRFFGISSFWVQIQTVAIISAFRTFETVDQQVLDWNDFKIPLCFAFLSAVSPTSAALGVGSVSLAFASN
jgi:hypothetical protein